MVEHCKYWFCTLCVMHDSDGKMYGNYRSRGWVNSHFSHCQCIDPAYVSPESFLKLITFREAKVELGGPIEAVRLRL